MLVASDIICPCVPFDEYRAPCLEISPWICDDVPSLGAMIHHDYEAYAGLYRTVVVFDNDSVKTGTSHPHTPTPQHHRHHHDLILFSSSSSLSCSSSFEKG